MPIDIIRPFGPCIGKFKLPTEMVGAVNSYIENVEKDEEKIADLDWSSRLVGKVTQEVRVQDEVLAPYSEFLTSCVEEYLNQIIPMGVVNFSTAPWKIVRRNGWVVRSYAGDFNPMHVHNNANICIAGFLKLPNWEEEMHNDNLDHAPARGKLCFMYGNTVEWSNNTALIEPNVGDCYVFPASLTHFVYPFKSDGERRSISINFDRVYVK
tara:strand:- start:4945 stop:5574 length:630 start_codon:yes stop_codon:yes gene_type:complete